jgi:hypothetical protein
MAFSFKSRRYGGKLSIKCRRMKIGAASLHARAMTGHLVRYVGLV